MSLVCPPPPKKQKCLSRCKVEILAKRVINWFVFKRPLVVDSEDHHSFVDKFDEEEAKKMIEGTPAFALEGLKAGDKMYSYVVRAVVREFLCRFSDMEPTEVLQLRLHDTTLAYESLKREHNALKTKYRKKRVTSLRQSLPRAAKRNRHIVLEK